jgi:hypothetical protein
MVWERLLRSALQIHIDQTNVEVIQWQRFQARFAPLDAAILGRMQGIALAP